DRAGLGIGAGLGDEVLELVGIARGEHDGMAMLGEERAERAALAAGADGADLEPRDVAAGLGEGRERRCRQHAERHAAQRELEELAATQRRESIMRHDRLPCGKLTSGRDYRAASATRHFTIATPPARAAPAWDAGRAEQGGTHEPERSGLATLVEQDRARVAQRFPVIVPEPVDRGDHTELPIEAKEGFKEILLVP